jgi:hypothetical protein
MNAAKKILTVGDDGSMRSKSWQRWTRQWMLLVVGVIVGAAFISAIQTDLANTVVLVAILSLVALAVFLRFRSIDLRFADPVEIGRFWRRRSVPLAEVERFAWADKSNHADQRKVGLVTIEGATHDIPALGQYAISSNAVVKSASREAAEQTVIELNAMLAEWRAANPGTLEA